MKILFYCVHKSTYESMMQLNVLRLIFSCIRFTNHPYRYLREEIALKYFTKDVFFESTSSLTRFKRTRNRISLQALSLPAIEASIRFHPKLLNSIRFCIAHDWTQFIQIARFAPVMLNVAVMRVQNICPYCIRDWRRVLIPSLPGKLKRGRKNYNPVFPYMSNYSVYRRKKS